MASQITHIVYAKKLFEKYNLLPEEKDEFILGATFPDIRRIDPTIRRKDTHLHFYPINLNFENLTPFEAGWKFHLYCDMRREEILNQYGFYSIGHTEEFCRQPAKMLEDELVYDEYNNWEKLVNYFNDVPFISNGINVPKETFELWYSILANYMNKKPNNSSVKIFLLKQSDIAPIANNIIETVDKLRKNDKVIGLLKRVCKEII
jgi:hypothetical protein